MLPFLLISLPRLLLTASAHTTLTLKLFLKLNTIHIVLKPTCSLFDSFFPFHFHLSPNPLSSTTTFYEDFSTPLILFDAASSTCGLIEQGQGLYFSLVGVPDDGTVGIEWNQLQGSPIGACPTGFLIFFSFFKLFFLSLNVPLLNSSNCGGNGNSFLFYPLELLNSCETYEWSATVTFGSDGEYDVVLCEATYPAAPQGGSCSAILGSASCATPLSTINIDCRFIFLYPDSKFIFFFSFLFFKSGFSVSCGSSGTFTKRIFKRSQAGDALISVETEPLSGAITSLFKILFDNDK